MHTLEFISAVSAAILCGIVYTIDQKILTTLTPLGLLTVNAILSLIISSPFLIGNIHTKIFEQSPDLHTLLWVLGAGVATALANFAIYYSVQKLGASTATIFEISYPFFVLLLSSLFFRTRLNIYFFVGAFFTFIGSFVIIKYASGNIPT